MVNNERIRLKILKAAIYETIAPGHAEVMLPSSRRSKLKHQKTHFDLYLLVSRGYLGPSARFSPALYILTYQTGPLHLLSYYRLTPSLATMPRILLFILSLSLCRPLLSRNQDRGAFESEKVEFEPESDPLQSGLSEPDDVDMPIEVILADDSSDIDGEIEEGLDGLEEENDTIPLEVVDDPEVDIPVEIFPVDDGEA